MRLLGIIGAAPEGFTLWSEEHGQRPSTLLTEGMEGLHVNLVDIRTFFPIDLDIDKEAVHHLGGGWILETLMSHHMAPVTRSIPDR